MRKSNHLKTSPVYKVTTACSTECDLVFPAIIYIDVTDRDVIEYNSKLVKPDPSIERKLINFCDSWIKIKNIFGEKITNLKIQDDFDSINHHISSIISQV